MHYTKEDQILRRLSQTERDSLLYSVDGINHQHRIDSLKRIYPKLFVNAFKNDLIFDDNKIKYDAHFLGYFTPREVLFSNYRFEKKTSFSLNKNSYVFYLSNIKFQTSTFEKTVRIWDNYYITPLMFVNCTFNDTLLIEAGWLHPTFFLNTVKFERCKFNETVIVENFPFFNEKSTFYESTFKNKVSMRAVFDTLHFNESTFQDTVWFNSSFMKDVDFYKSTFHKLLSFTNEKIMDYSSSTGSDFFDGLSLSNCEFRQGIEFGLSFIDKYLDLSSSNSEHVIDLSRIRKYPGSYYSSDDPAELKAYEELYEKKQPIKLYLGKSNLPKINLRYIDFELAFYNSDNYEDKTRIYEFLLRIQKENGYMSSFEKLDKEYKSFMLTSKGLYLQDWISRIWWDYGYKKSLIFRNTFIIFLIFYTINLFQFRKLNNEVYNIEKLNYFNRFFSNKNIYGNYITSLIGYLEPAFFYTFFIFFGFKLSIDNFKFNPPNKVSLHSFRIIYIFFQYIIGIVCLAYLANFVITR